MAHEADSTKTRLAACYEVAIIAAAANVIAKAAYFEAAWAAIPKNYDPAGTKAWALIAREVSVIRRLCETGSKTTFGIEALAHTLELLVTHDPCQSLVGMNREAVPRDPAAPN